MTIPTSPDPTRQALLMRLVTGAKPLDPRPPCSAYLRPIPDPEIGRPDVPRRLADVPMFQPEDRPRDPMEWLVAAAVVAGPLALLVGWETWEAYCSWRTGRRALRLLRDLGEQA